MGIFFIIVVDLEVGVSNVDVVNIYGVIEEFLVVVVVVVVFVVFVLVCVFVFGVVDVVFVFGCFYNCV